MGQSSQHGNSRGLTRDGEGGGLGDRVRYVLVRKRGWLRAVGDILGGKESSVGSADGAGSGTPGVGGGDEASHRSSLDHLHLN